MLRVLCLWIVGILIDYFWDVPLHWVFNFILAGIIICLLIKSPLRIAGILWILWLGISVIYNKSFFAFKHNSIPHASALVLELSSQAIEKPKTWEIQAEVRYWKEDGKWVKPTLPWSVKAYFSKKVKKPNLGQIWLIADSLQLFERPLFPYEKDWFAYYKERGIAGRIFVKPNRATMLRPFKKSNWRQTWKKLQAYFLDSFAAMPNAANREVAEAMVLGETSGINPRLQSAYTDLGAVHILSVSGMHLGILFWVLNALLGRLSQWIPSFKIPSFLLILVTIWSYAGITGFSAPVLRASLVFSLILLAKLLNRPVFPVNLLASTCWFLLLINPLDIFQAGFQLSYLAVLGILWFHQPVFTFLKSSSKKLIHRIWNAFWESTALAFSAQIFTFPLVIYYFHQFPQLGLYFFLNPILMVLSSLALMASFALLLVFPISKMCSIPECWQVCARLVDVLYDIMHQLMLFFSGASFPPHAFLYLSDWQLGLVYLLLFSLLIWSKSRKSMFLWLFNSLLIFQIGYTFFRKNWQMPQLSFTQQVNYRKELVVCRLSGGILYVYGPAKFIQDSKWFTGHITPMASYFSVLDTVLINKKPRPFGPGRFD